jgi:hypothetical protein
MRACWGPCGWWWVAASGPLRRHGASCMLQPLAVACRNATPGQHCKLLCSNKALEADFEARRPVLPAVAGSAAGFCGGPRLKWAFCPMGSKRMVGWPSSQRELCGVYLAGSIQQAGAVLLPAPCWARWV